MWRMRCDIFIVGGRHHDQLFELRNIEYYCADRRWSCIPTARVARGGSPILPGDCHWLGLVFCQCWKNLVRVSYCFAAFRLTSLSQYATVICSCRLCRTCFSMFDDEDLLLTAAAFIVVSYRIKRNFREYSGFVQLTKAEVNANGML